MSRTGLPEARTISCSSSDTLSGIASCAVTGYASRLASTC